MTHRDTPFHIILSQLKEQTHALPAGKTLRFTVPDPDLCPGCYAGETYEYHGQTYRHHSWHSWSTLAHLLGCRMLTPRPVDTSLIEVRIQKLDPAASFHRPSDTHNPVAELVEAQSKYHPNSTFARIDKREEPDFLYHYFQALDEVKVSKRKRVLDLGVYRGDEFSTIRALLGEDHGIDMVGVDWDEEAIHEARRRLPNASFYAHDINDLATLDLGQFDLLITIGTLQSPGIETKPLVMDLVQNHLTQDGALIIGFPNSRWIDGELIHGAKAPNYPFSELSLLIKDIHWIKKYLQQHRYRVRIFGQSYLFLVATKISISK